ncbi:MAG: low molecular weight protein arginine phosphatase [Proteobacteria bacterium]|nr:low molecular weight protein arginine phosphatase [Pseudomonadota bacterium]
MKILFVCTANICRSFMAENIFNKLAAENGLINISVVSAAILDMKGAPADQKAIEILKENGIDVSDHKSTLLTENIVSESDKILVMTHQHKETIAEKYPDAKDKIFLLKSFSISCSEQDDNHFYDIKDPYKLSDFHYRDCFAEIYISIEGLMKYI